MYRALMRTSVIEVNVFC